MFQKVTSYNKRRFAGKLGYLAENYKFLDPISGWGDALFILCFFILLQLSLTLAEISWILIWEEDVCVRVLVITNTYFKQGMYNQNSYLRRNCVQLYVCFIVCIYNFYFRIFFWIYFLFKHKNNLQLCMFNVTEINFQEETSIWFVNVFVK